MRTGVSERRHYLHLKHRKRALKLGKARLRHRRPLCRVSVRRQAREYVERAAGSGSKHSSAQTHACILAHIHRRRCAHARVCTPRHARAWMQRITCNYGPCHLPCLVPVLCARGALSLVERLRHAWRKRREHAEYADNETLQALLPVTRLVQRRLTATGRSCEGGPSPSYFAIDRPS